MIDRLDFIFVSFIVITLVLGVMQVAATKEKSAQNTGHIETTTSWETPESFEVSKTAPKTSFSATPSKEELER